MYTIDNLLIECQDYVEVLKSSRKGFFLTRGTHSNIEDIICRNHSVHFREPLNMPLEIHKKINSYYENKFGWPIRNGVFTYAMLSNYDTNRDLGYGNTYFCFPCGNFEYVFDPNIFDLAGHQNNFWKQNNNPNIESFINSINYSNTNINSVSSKKFYEGRSVEIILNCSKYFLVHTKFATELINKIWF